MFWGIFMLMVMLGSGSGLRNGVMRGFKGSATNSFFVWTQRTPKPFDGMPAGRRIQLDERTTCRRIRDKVPEVDVVAPRNQLGGFMGGNNVDARQRRRAPSA